MDWLLLALVFLSVLEVLAARANSATRTLARQMHPRWTWFHRWRWAFGVFLALGSPFISYRFAGGDDRTYRVFGFPLPWAAFDDHGLDYVGPLSPLTAAANAALCFFLPGLLLWCWAWAARTSGRHQG